MPTLTRRLQVLLDEARYAHLHELAARRDTTVAALVRAALDQTYPTSGIGPAEAATRLLERDPLDDLTDWADAKRTIEAQYERGIES